MIEVAELRKHFVAGRGRKAKRVEAVRGVTFAAPNGVITGLVGPNGAGKTTTLRMIGTLVRPDSGWARVDGHDSVASALEVRRRLGVLSDARGLYLRLTARENIRYYGRLRGMDDRSIDATIERLARLIDMSDLLERRTDGFSQGERMKVAIARALVHDPQNLVLDEPSNGLDIMSTRALRELLRRLRDDGKCILMSSHIMQEVAALSERIVIIAHGQAVASGTTAELMAQAGATTLEDAFVTLAGEPITTVLPELGEGAPIEAPMRRGAFP
jgi:sodium transport system ATP-binding protein